MIVGGGAARIAVGGAGEVILQEGDDLGTDLLFGRIPQRELELGVFEVEAEVLGADLFDGLVGDGERETVGALVDGDGLAVATGAGRYG